MNYTQASRKPITLCPSCSVVQSNDDTSHLAEFEAEMVNNRLAELAENGYLALDSYSYTNADHCDCCGNHNDEEWYNHYTLWVPA